MKLITCFFLWTAYLGRMKPCKRRRAGLFVAANGFKWKLLPYCLRWGPQKSARLSFIKVYASGFVQFETTGKRILIYDKCGGEGWGRGGGDRLQCGCVYKRRVLIGWRIRFIRLEFFHAVFGTDGLKPMLWAVWTVLPDVDTRPVWDHGPFLWGANSPLSRFYLPNGDDS